ncbi:hypothetical protein HMPREF9422_0604 [Streptococcus cristatus ATCC 51100]|uniref:Uncharacterized protein n=1 Tax=Streptococcus cristatus ATCC 51100 TaxID=889201 RepID=A0AAV3EHI9_STRCR|nr:hypothetical protein HMPREF9422_0604 [Streptococcus cristatus ATCC 51100]EGU69214.1 hypothetical protein HMPREF9960_0348 [Streptococcus cristatus ATCC 51100]
MSLRLFSISLLLLLFEKNDNFPNAFVSRKILQGKKPYSIFKN